MFFLPKFQETIKELIENDSERKIRLNGQESNVTIHYDLISDIHHPTEKVFQIQFADQGDADDLSRILFKYGIGSIAKNNDESKSVHANLNKYNLYLSIDEIKKLFIALKLDLNIYDFDLQTISEKQDPATQEVLQLFENEKAVLKVVQPPVQYRYDILHFDEKDVDHWITQLQDPTKNRPSRKNYFDNLRYLANMPSIGKANPLTGKVFQYVKKPARLDSYHHTQKTATIVAPTNTGCMLFYRDDRIIYIWDLDTVHQKEGRYVFKENVLTNNGFWLGVESESEWKQVIYHDKSRQAISIKQIQENNRKAVNEFKKDDTKIIKWNECLFGLPKGAPKALGFRDQSLSSRINTLYVMYKNKEELKCQEDIPILNFQMGKKQRAYSHVERVQDLISILNGNQNTLEYQLLIRDNYRLLTQIVNSAVLFLPPANPTWLNFLKTCKTKKIPLLLEKLDGNKWNVNRSYREKYFWYCYENYSVDSLISQVGIHSVKDLLESSANNSKFNDPKENAKIFAECIRKKHYTLAINFSAGKNLVNTTIEERHYFFQQINTDETITSKELIHLIKVIFTFSDIQDDKDKFAEIYNAGFETLVRAYLPLELDLKIELFKWMRVSINHLVDVIKLYDTIFYDKKDQNETILHFAIRINDRELIKALTQDNASFTKENAEKETPLSLLMEMGREELLEEVLRIHPNASSLTYASQNLITLLDRALIANEQGIDRTTTIDFMIKNNAPVSHSLHYFLSYGAKSLNQVIDRLNPQQLEMYPRETKWRALQEITYSSRRNLTSILKLIEAIDTFDGCEFNKKESNPIFQAINHYQESTNEESVKIIIKSISKGIRTHLDEIIEQTLKLNQTSLIINQLLWAFIFYEQAREKLNTKTLDQILLHFKNATETPIKQNIRRILLCKQYQPSKALIDIFAKYEGEELNLLYTHHAKFLLENKLLFLDQYLANNNLVAAKKLLLLSIKENEKVISEDDLTQANYILYLSLLNKDTSLVKSVMHFRGVNCNELFEHLIQKNQFEEALYLSSLSNIDNEIMSKAMPFIKWVASKHPVSALNFAYMQNNKNLFQFLCGQNSIDFSILDQLIKDDSFDYVEIIFDTALERLNEQQKNALFLYLVLKDKIELAGKVYAVIEAHDPVIRHPFNRTVMHYLATKQKSSPEELALITELLHNEAYRQLVFKKDSANLSPMYLAIKGRNTQLIECMLEAETYESREDLDQVLHYLAENPLFLLNHANPEKLLKQLLEKRGSLFKKNAKSICAFDVMIHAKNTQALIICLDNICQLADQNQISNVLTCLLEANEWTHVVTVIKNAVSFDQEIFTKLLSDFMSNKNIINADEVLQEMIATMSFEKFTVKDVENLGSIFSILCKNGFLKSINTFRDKLVSSNINILVDCLGDNNLYHFMLSPGIKSALSKYFNEATEFIKWLCERGADIHAINQQGESLLETVLHLNNYDLVAALIDSQNQYIENEKIKKMLADGIGYDYLKKAIDSKSEKMVEWLMMNGVSPMRQYRFHDINKSQSLLDYALVKITKNDVASTRILEILVSYSKFQGTEKPSLFARAGTFFNNNNIPISISQKNETDVKLKRVFSIRSVSETIRAKQTISEVLDYVDELQKNFPEYLFERRGAFKLSLKGHQWENKSISRTGTKLLKMAKLQILTLYSKDQTLDAQTKARAEAFLNHQRKRWKSTETASLQIFHLFGNMNQPKNKQAFEQKLKIAEEKINQWLDRVSPLK